MDGWMDYWDKSADFSNIQVSTPKKLIKVTTSPQKVRDKCPSVSLNRPSAVSQDTSKGGEQLRDATPPRAATRYSVWRCDATARDTRGGGLTYADTVETEPRGKPILRRSGSCVESRVVSSHLSTERERSHGIAETFEKKERKITCTVYHGCVCAWVSSVS